MAKLKLACARRGLKNEAAIIGGKVEEIIKRERRKTSAKERHELLRGDIAKKQNSASGVAKRGETAARGSGAKASKLKISADGYQWPYRRKRKRPA